MSWKRVILAWTALLALMFASAAASGRADVSVKPHVGVFDLVAASGTGVNADASAEEHWGSRCLPTADTLDFPFAAKGGGKLSKVAKETRVETLGGGKFVKKTKVIPGRGPGQSRSEMEFVTNAEGKLIRTRKFSFDRANKFQHKKPARGGPEGRGPNDP